MTIVCFEVEGILSAETVAPLKTDWEVTFNLPLTCRFVYEHISAVYVDFGFKWTHLLHYYLCTIIALSFMCVNLQIMVPHFTSILGTNLVYLYITIV